MVTITVTFTSWLWYCWLIWLMMWSARWLCQTKLVHTGPGYHLDGWLFAYRYWYTVWVSNQSPRSTHPSIFRMVRWNKYQLSGWVTINGDGECSFLAAYRRAYGSGRLTWSKGLWPLALFLHSPREPGELSQYFEYDEGIIKIIIFTVIIFIHSFVRWLIDCCSKHHEHELSTDAMNTSKRGPLYADIQQSDEDSSQKNDHKDPGAVLYSELRR